MAEPHLESAMAEDERMPGKQRLVGRLLRIYHHGWRELRQQLGQMADYYHRPFRVAIVMTRTNG